MVSWYHCQSEYARNISGEFLSSVYAQLKFILHVTEWLSHDSLASWCCAYNTVQVIGNAIFLCVSVP